MTLTNHLLTGATLAKFLPLPIAILLAFASHFVLDALPHFGYKTIDERMRHMGMFRTVILLDVLAAAAASMWLVKSGHVLWLIAGLIACSPDLVWIYRLTIEEKFGKVKPTMGNRFIQFHRTIQKYERIWGIAIEVMYGSLMYIVIR